MRRLTFGKRWSLVALVACSLLAGDALAQRGDRGERGGGGRGDGGSSSFRGGGGGEGRSFRGGEGGGDRSFSRSRSGGAERSFSRGAPSGQSFRSFDRGTSPSESFRSGQSMRESFRGSPRGSFDAGRQAIQPRDLGGQRTLSREGMRSGQQFGDQQFRSRGDSGMRTARSQTETGVNRYQTNRPTDDQVRNFLQMRDDRGGIQSRDFSARDIDRGERNLRQGDQTFRRDTQQFEHRTLRRRLDDSIRRGERDFADLDGRGREFRDGNFDRDYQRWRENVWTGDGRRGRDDRDWSGRWRDGGRFAVARDVRRWWGDRDWDDDDFPFRFGWWGGQNWYGRRWDHWDYWARSRPYYWWYWATAPRLSNWIAFRWGTPYYWDYGPGEYIYYDDGGVYVNGRWYQTAPVYYDNTVRIVEQAPELTAEEAARVEWLPLGVFAVTRDGRSEPDVLVQLAVTQDGVIGGTAVDQRSGVTYSVEGTVEKQSQRAIWSYMDARGRRVVTETSIFNLTQPEATGLVQYGPENMQVVELVRLDPPEGAVSSTATTDELPAPTAR